MSTTSRVAGAVAAGYVLGRFKKLRMAVLVASAMSNPKFRNAAAEHDPKTHSRRDHCRRVDERGRGQARRCRQDSCDIDSCLAHRHPQPKPCRAERQPPKRYPRREGG